jgi:FAD synthetase
MSSDSSSIEPLSLSALEQLVPRPLFNQILSSISIIQEAIERYTLSGLAISFNGGKDCSVITHLLYLAVADRLRKKLEYAAANSSHEFSKTVRQHMGQVIALYFETDQSFDEVNAFARSSACLYGFTLEVSRETFKRGLAVFLEQHPGVRGILMGTRRTDPHSQHLTPFVLTDPGWPQVMRVHAILDWTYDDVWSFLRLLRVPYCSLYDRGFTSIGLRCDTEPNPALRQADGSYAPAYRLRDPLLERAGRCRRALEQFNACQHAGQASAL